MAASVKVEDLVLEFKRSGRFDEIRKQLLDEFSSSPSGQQLYTSLCRLASETETNSKAGLIGALGKSALFNNTRNKIGQELLNAPKFKNKVESQLRSTFYEMRKSTPAKVHSPQVVNEKKPIDPVQEKVDVDLFLAEIETSNASLSGSLIKKIGPSKGSKSIALVEAPSISEKVAVVAKIGKEDEEVTNAQTSPAAMEKMPVNENKTTKNDCQDDSIAESQPPKESLGIERVMGTDHDSISENIEKDRRETGTEANNLDTPDKDEAMSSNQGTKSRFKVGNEYACLIPGDAIRYFNVVITNADYKNNEYVVEECLDEDQEIEPQIWTVKQEQLLHFLNSVMFRSIKVDDDVWVLCQDGADDPVASEFSQAKVTKKNKASVRVVYPDGRSHLIPKNRVLKI